MSKISEWGQRDSLVSLVAATSGYLRSLQMSRELFTQRFPFSAWPNPAVPPVAAGVYAIWKRDDLIYCGMSGREIEAKTQATPKKYGLLTRLASHASGRLSGDQFCVYVANRFVIPMLSADDVPLFASGELNLDAKTRRFIHTHLDYAYNLAQTSAEAFALEKSVRRGEIFGQKPLLNPL